MSFPFHTLLADQSRHWLVTGGAGFIGSHLVQTLLTHGQTVTVLDNFATGSRANLESVALAVGAEAWSRCTVLEWDIRNKDTCHSAVRGVDYVLHQAALGSVPRSLEDPATTHDVNVDGFVNMLIASRDAQVSRFVYAASSSTYGDHPWLPKVEDSIGKPLSPYGATKYINEIYADVFGRCYGLPTIGLRYFNVFGPRQDPNGAYAAVMPLWFRNLLTQEPVLINGDGETSRDFCYVTNVVQANILAATTQNAQAINQVYNVACGQRTTLNELFTLIRTLTGVWADVLPVYREFRTGDVRHSLASIAKAHELLGYTPTHSVAEGLNETAEWYKQCFVR